MPGSKGPTLRLILHTRYIIYGNKRLGVQFIDEFHQLLVLTFVHNGDDLVVFFKMIGTDGFIDRGTAVQISCNKLAQFFLFLRNNADTSLDIIVKIK